MRISDWSSDVCSSDLVAGADAGEDLPLAQFSGVEFETQQLVGALDEFAGHDLADAQVEPGEVVDADGGRRRSCFRRSGGSGNRSRGRTAGRGFRRSYGSLCGRSRLQVFLAGFGHGSNLLRVDAGEQRAVRPDGVVEPWRVDVAQGCQRRVEEIMIGRAT